MLAQTKYPFKFLDAYSRDDRDIFFGRDEEVEALYQMVFQTDLILVYGASGTGKTSLIQCGLASKFQPYEWMALSIRRGDNLNDSLEKALADAGAGDGAEAASSRPDTVDADNLDWLTDAADVPAPALVSPVAIRLRNLYLRHFKPVFLIFDQFEELYILGSRDEQKHFADTVREILRIEQPVKVLLSIREEYLGYLYEFERNVPELLRKKLRIEPMNLEKVQTVVRGIGRLPYSNVHLPAGEEAAIGAGIFEKLKERENVLTIELPYLQVLLDKLYLHITGDRSRQANAEITLGALQQMGDIGDVLRNFLDDQVQANALELGVPPDTIKKLLAPFVTLDGTKDPLSATQLHARLPELDAALVTRSLQAFQASRILRFDEKEQRYEVAHDSLARQIATYQDAEDIALQKTAQMIRTQLLMEADKRDVFSEKQLLFMEPYLAKLQLSTAETAWVEESRAYWKRIREEDAQKERDALKKEADRIAAEKAEAERRRKRALVTSLVAAVLVLAAGAATFFAFQKSTEADREAQKASEAISLADEKTRQANRDSIRVEQKTLEADSLSGVATNLKSEAEKSAQLVVLSRLEDARKQIVALEYGVAYRTLLNAEELGVMSHEVGLAMYEITYWLMESEKFAKAEMSANRVAKLLGKAKTGTITNLKNGRALLQKMNPDEYRRVRERYFPILLPVPPGTAILGSADGGDDEKPPHPAVLSVFKMARTETTWWQYNLFCEATGKEKPEKPAGWGGEGDNPVNNVTWYDAVDYANWLNKQEGLEEIMAKSADGDYELKRGAKGYRLPTEAEWEYAARGGKDGSPEYAGSDDIDSVAWYSDNSGSRTHGVENKKANALGLFDMSGNVWEWCWDWYGDYLPNPEKDYSGPATGSLRVLRGGSWDYSAGYCRVAYRGYLNPDVRSISIGFRLVFVP